MDSSIVRVHQQGTDAVTDSHEKRGKSRSGNSTKFFSLDSYALPVHLELSGGQSHALTHAEKLIDESPLSRYIVADIGYDSEKFTTYIQEKGEAPVFTRRIGSDDIDWYLYKHRHLVENAFSRTRATE
ncbi:transposase [Psychromonas arctica]|uniref:transposase n=1 Tax=Psychromonas arctica TaxID=168275 RepID=UPI00146FAEBF